MAYNPPTPNDHFRQEHDIPGAPEKVSDAAIVAIPWLP